MRTIIKGCIYTNGKELLRPLFSGDYWLCDCMVYLTEGEIMANYNQNIAIDILANDPFRYNGVYYYETYTQLVNTKDFVRLSDISELEFVEENTDLT